MANSFQEHGCRWFHTLKPMQEYAAHKGHKFLVAHDEEKYCEDGSTPTKKFGSYKTANEFWRRTKKIDPSNKAFYVIVPEGVACSLYADIEWDTTWKSKAEVLELIFGLLTTHNPKVPQDDYIVLDASRLDQSKGSLHLHHADTIFRDVNDQRKFWNQIYIDMEQDEGKYGFVDVTKKSFIPKYPIDFSVYNKNRQMRLPFSSKINGKTMKLERPLIPDNQDDFDMIDCTITGSAEDAEDYFDVSDFSEEIVCTRKKVYNKKVVETVLSENGLDPTSINTWTGNFVNLKNKRNSKCPISGEVHKGDPQYLILKRDCVEFQCRSDRCRDINGSRGRKILHTWDKQGETLADEVPYKQLIYKFIGIKAVDQEELLKKIKVWQNEMLNTLNKYIHLIVGGSEPYIIYRRTLYDRKGRKSIGWGVQKVAAYAKSTSMFSVNIPVGSSTRKHTLFSLWYDWMHCSRYSRDDCIPLAPNHVPDPTVFNRYNGLSITKERAIREGNNDVKPLLDFIKTAWCQEDERSYNYVISWMAHLIQKPWKKMMSAIVLKGQEGSGKGFIVSLLGEIVGKNHYYHATSQKDLFGDFNFLLDDKLLCFGDEITWGGNKVEAGTLKTLLTEKTRTSNCKNIPQRVVSNMINWIFASNNDWVIPAGSRARRYCVLETNNHMYTLKGKKRVELFEITPESFARYLYSVDISNFDPTDVPKTSGLQGQKELTMCGTHVWLRERLEEDDMTWDMVYSNKDLYERFERELKTQRLIGKTTFLKQLSNIPGVTRGRFAVSGLKTRIHGTRIGSRSDLIQSINDYYDCILIDSTIKLNEPIPDEVEAIEEELDLSKDIEGDLKGK